MPPKLFVFGSGPRTRAIATELIKPHFPEASVGRYESREAALAQARFSSQPVLLFDARCYPDGRIVSLLRHAANGATGFATSSFKKAEPQPAAFCAESGDALVRYLERGDHSTGPEVGMWFVEDGPDSPSQPRDLRVNVRANGLGFTGYATAARHLMIGMHDAGAEVFWSDDWVEDESADITGHDRALLESFRREPKDCDVTIVHNTPTYPNGTPFMQRYRDTIVGNSPLIWSTMFEADGIPSRWAEQLNRCEGVWVPCSQNLEAFARSGVRRDLLRVVPIGLDVENYDIDGAEIALPQRHAFNFFSVFEWRLRKGYDVLLRAYAAAFEKHEDVALFLRTSMIGTDVHAALAEALDELGLKREEMPPIYLIPDKIPQTLLPSVYRAMDAFVLPSRGEAFGIPYVEAMALGLPTIGTAFGGPLDYLTTDTGFPIPCVLRDVDRAFSERMPIYRGMRWAEPSVEATAAAMRAVYDAPAAARAVAANGAALIRTKFNRRHAGAIAADALSQTPKKRRVKKTSEASLYYIGVAASLAGYGSETRGFLSALDRQGISVQLALYSYEDLGEMLRPDEAQLIKRSTALRAPESSPVLYHLLPTQAGEIPAGRTSIVRTMEETDGLAEGWLQALQRFDQVWLPSTFNADTFERAGVDSKRIRIVPGAIDSDFWSPSIGGVEVPGAGAFRFLAVFDWMGRKGWDLLVHAYMRAFSNDDDVSLTLKVTDLVARAEGAALDTRGAIERVALAAAPEKVRSGKAPKVVVLSQRMSEDSLARLYASHHAFVGPSHAEGWGRAHMEAMSCGLPTIGTRWGGNLAFMNDENSYLIDIEGIVEAQHDTARYVGRRWAQPSVEHLQTLLRRVYDKPHEAGRRAATARREIVAKFSLDAIGKTLRERIEEVTQLDFPAPPVPSRAAVEDLRIFIDARGPSTALGDCIARIAKHTRSSASMSILTSPGEERRVKASVPAGLEYGIYTSYDEFLANAPQAEFTAIVRSDVLLSVAWDRVLIEALNAHFTAGCVVPRFFAVGEQSERNPKALYHLDTAEFFDQFAIHCMINDWGYGANAMSFAPLCMLLKSGLYSPAGPNLFQTSFPAGSGAWTAFDCLGHLAKAKAS